MKRWLIAVLPAVVGLGLPKPVPAKALLTQATNPIASRQPNPAWTIGKPSPFCLPKTARALRRSCLFLVAGLMLWAGSAAARPLAPLYYHVFVRSFADSDGDRIGDLRGLAGHLDYLARLHVTHILLTPVQASPFYHNYFATDFDAVDPAYGGAAGWTRFIRAAHGRGMKVILDEEFQYVAQGHSWWRDNEGRPGGPRGRFVLWNRPDRQTGPEPFLAAPRYQTADGRMVGIAMVDLDRDDVRAWFLAMLRRRVDPHGDGSLTDGVDGFRLDHMMDDLDGKHRETDLFARFWRPVITGLKAVNPRLEVIAEQSDWGYGADHLRRGGIDAVFAFPLRKAIAGLDKPAIVAAMRRTAQATPPGKRQLVFIENHDVDRFASVVGSDPRKLRVGAVLDLTLGTDAIIYYGQELGMRGVELPDRNSDGAQIPLREAFRWRADLSAPGSAIWYQGEAPWWTGRFNRTADGVSVEEEEASPGSLLTYYRWLTSLRGRRPELSAGRYEPGCQDSGPVFCFTRRLGARWTFVAVNLSGQLATVAAPPGRQRYDLSSGRRLSGPRIDLAPWGTMLVGGRD
jgi:glycosidase